MNTPNLLQNGENGLLTSFHCLRSTLPKFGVMIMNRLNRENLNECISKEMEFKVQKPFLLYKNASSKI